MRREPQEMSAETRERAHAVAGRLARARERAKAARRAEQESETRTEREEAVSHG